MNSVFVVMEDWKIDSGESGVYTSVFSSFEKALEYYKHLKERYAIDYEIDERKEDIDTFEEYINEDMKNAKIIVSFNDSFDYYEIDITEKNIDENL